MTAKSPESAAHWRPTLEPRRASITIPDMAGAADRLASVVSFLYPFLLTILLLFNPQLSPYGPAGQIAATVLMLAYVLRTRPAVLRGQWIVLFSAAVCLASTLWSVRPDLTIRASAQVLLTLLSGVLIGVAPRPSRAIVGIFLAFTIFVFVALAAGGTVALGNSGAEAFSGLNSSKNYFAAQVVILLVSAAAIVPLAKSRPWLAIAMAAAAFLVGCMALLQARSATAIISSIAGVAVFVLAYISMRLPPKARTGALAAAFIVLTPLAAVYDDLETAITQETLETFHKKSTLTGRAALWYSADRIIAGRPLLGQGYYTFWVRGNLAAEDLWERNFIEGRTGFNFHNTPRELAIGVGWAGFATIAASLIYLLAVLVAMSMFRPSISLAFWLAVAACIVVRLYTESLFPFPFATETVLLAAALAAGLKRLHETGQGAARAPRSSPPPRA